MPTLEWMRCPVIDPVWDRRCVRQAGHAGPHRNDEIAGDTLTWGSVGDVRRYVRDGDDRG